MSRINFDNLVSEHPERKRALRTLEGWINEHEDASVLYPSRLARETRIDPVSLAATLTLLVKEGVLRRVYKVTTPTGVLADDEFDDPRQIPEQLPDRKQHYFATAESDVVAVFHKVA